MMEDKNLAPPGDLAGVQRAKWVAARSPQTTDCVINGFYAVGPTDGPPIAYVFGREEAGLIGAVPEVLEALRVAEMVLAKLSDAVCGNEQHRDHSEFFKGYNAVTRRVQGEATSALPTLRAAIAKATGQEVRS